MGKNRSGLGNTKSIYGDYSLGFVLFALIMILPFYLFRGRHFYGGDDGVYQQYIYFLYVGKWIKEVCRNIFVLHTFTLPMWDMSIGMGADPIVTIASSVNPLTDVMCWISALIPARYSEYAFDIVFLAKLYLSGVSFLFFANRRGIRREGAVAGSLVYTFSSFIYIGFYQVFFLNAFILFPLLMNGACRLWEEKKHRSYVISLALCTMYSFYFTYMMMLLLVVYCIVRYISEARKKEAPKLLPLISSYVIRSLTGILIGIWVQIPSMMNIAGLGRMNSDKHLEFFSLSRLSLLADPFSFINTNTDAFWGFSSLIVVALILLFSKKDRSRLKILFVLYAASFAFPVIGSVFNGMNTSSLRYIFGFDLLLSYIIAVEYERLPEFKGRKELLISFSLAGFLLLSLVITRDLGSLISGVSLMISALAVIMINRYSRRRDIMYRAVVFISCLILSVYAFGMKISGSATPFNGADGKMFENEMDRFLPQIKGSVNRYDRLPLAYTGVPVNSSMITDINSFDFYNSNCNNYVDRYYLDMGIVSNSLGVYQCGLRGRDYPELLCGTGYISVFEGSPKAVSAPYAYEAVSRDGDYTLYKAERGASIAFFYEDVAPLSQFEALDPMGREELMMHALVVDRDIPSCDLGEGYREIPYTLGETSGITFNDDGTFTVSGEGHMTLDIEPLSGVEIDLLLSDIHSDSMYMIVPELHNGEDVVKIDFYVGVSDRDIYYHWKDELLFTFGMTEDTADSVSLRFTMPGTYSLGDIKIYARTSEQIEDTLDDFYETAGMEDISYSFEGSNELLLNVSSDKDKYLYIAIPYSEGWTATDNGEAVPVYRAGLAFMAIDVSEGEHEIKLQYKTPGLAAGASVSLIVTLSYVVYEIVRKGRSGKAHQSSSSSSETT